MLDDRIVSIKIIQLEALNREDFNKICILYNNVYRLIEQLDYEIIEEINYEEENPPPTAEILTFVKRG